MDQDFGFAPKFDINFAGADIVHQAEAEVRMRNLIANFKALAG